MKSRKYSYELLYFIFTTIVVSAINYFIWHSQNSISQNQKMYETKISSIEKFALSVSKFKYYNEFTVRIKFEQIKRERIILDSISDVKTKKINSVLSDYTNEIQNSLKFDFPIQYEMHMKNLDYQSEGLTSILIPQFLFEHKTSEKLRILQEMYNESFISQELELIIEEEKINIYDVDGNDLVWRINSKQDQLISEILSEMYNEVKN